jgi:uncharacterized protein with PIN domain
VADPVRFYIDQNFPGPVSRGLRRRGIDVLTAQDAGRCGQPDPDQLSFATSVGRVVVTYDTDFLELHRSGVPHAGIAWCPERKHTIGALIQSLILIHGAMDADAMRNHVEYL